MTLSVWQSWSSKGFFNKDRATSPLLLFASCLVALSLSFTAVRAQAQQSPQRLETSKPTEGELSGGQSHTYPINAAAGDYITIVVEQRGVDVALALFAPDGRKVEESASPDGANGPEAISFIARASGVYRLEITAVDKAAAVGHYEARLTQRHATSQDRSRIAAGRLVRQAQQLSGKGGWGITAEGHRVATAGRKTLRRHRRPTNAGAYAL